MVAAGCRDVPTFGRYGDTCNGKTVEDAQNV